MTNSFGPQMSSPSGSPQVADGVSNPMAHTFDELERNYDSPDQRGSMSAIETEEHAGSDTNHMIDELDGRDESRWAESALTPCDDSSDQE